MPVQFVVDCFGVDSEDARVVQATNADILAAQAEINQHLSSTEAQLLRIRVNSLALLKRFADYEGLTNVLPTLHLNPRQLLAKKLAQPLPDWLSNELIATSKLLQSKNEFQPQRSIADNVLFACNAGLLSSDFDVFIQTLAQLEASFLPLFNIPTIQERLHQHICLGLRVAENIADLFVQALANAGDIGTFLSTLNQQKYLEQLRGLNKKYQLNQVLPARTLDECLVESWPLLPLAEAQATNLAEKFNAALQVLEHKISRSEQPADSICDLVMDWPLLLNSLEQLLIDNPLLKTEALNAKLAQFSSLQSQALLAKLQQSQCPLVPANASINEVLTWTEKYFSYCRQAFLDQQSVDEVVTLSFSHWLLAHHQATISRSEYDWRQFSQQVCRYLDQAYLVVIIMVDALSALNQDLVLEELAGLHQLNLSQNIMFAPLPTLTEVGKMAVLTGQPAQTLSGSKENILRSRYQQYLSEPAALKVLKSWQQDAYRLTEASQLVVYFENRLDERLHECINFSNHRSDLKPIIRQLKRKIESWSKDAALLNREIAFFITADHGMTVTQSHYRGQQLGEIKERVFKLNQVAELSPEFVQINDYAVPKTRLRLSSSALLTHGGLTPEEVLIPFISLSSKLPASSFKAVEVKLVERLCKVQAYQRWQIELILTSRFDVNNINLSLSPPFQGKAFVNSLRANHNQTVILNFSADQAQEGLVELTLHLNFRWLTATANEQAINPLTVEFPASLLEKDRDSESFEGMFKQ